jgi:hypothetical protein
MHVCHHLSIREMSRSRCRYGAVPAGAAHQGGTSRPAPGLPSWMLPYRAGTDTDGVRPRAIALWGLACYCNLWGNGPQKTPQCPSHGPDHLVGLFPPGHEASKALAQAHVRLPTDVLDRLRLGFESEL